MDGEEKRLRYGGVEVRFPYPPYRAQHALMHGIITAANSGTHALLESPTGTGKSLALLCGALAWQEHIERKIKERKLEREHAALNVLPPPERKTPEKKKTPEKGKDAIIIPETQPEKLPTSDPTQPSSELIPRRRTRKPHRRRKKKPETKPKEEEEAGSDADFQDPIEFRDTSWQKHAKLKRPRSATETFGNAHLVARFESWERDVPLDVSDSEFGDDNSNDNSDLSGDEEGGDVPRKVPRIFYATRTHNQVSQVVDELRKTGYRPAMTVLASRREYCVRPEVAQLSNRNDVCKGLIKARKCSYFHNAQALAQRPELAGEVWDIEELVNLGKKHNGCPYYTSSEVYKKARIIFCPYNYIVDKTVRDAAGIKLKGDIVVFDEAHNIENFTRDSASFSIDVADFREVIDDLNDLIEEGKLGTPNSDLALAGNNIIEAFANVMRMIDFILAAPMEQDFDTEFTRLERQQLADIFEIHDVTPACIEECRRGINLIRERHEDDEEKENERNADADADIDGSQANGNASGIGYTGAGVGYGGEEVALQTPALIRKRRRRQKARAGEAVSDEAAPKSVSRCLFFANRLATTLEYYFPNRDDYCLVLQRRVKDFLATTKLNLWCLNSAVAFQPLARTARTVVVTSGTLSPLRSFAGELGTDFKVRKSLPHVIDARKQLHAAVVSHGPGRNTLFEATYARSSTFQFQDSLGEALVQYCEIIPAGVLVFLPSYRLLDKLRARWQMSGILERISAVKGGVYFEPSRRGEDFDRMMVAYAAAATSPAGAVLFGVCRGKLAEGIDFRDETARAVIVVGIPYPHRGDLQVVQKQAWNNRVRSSSKSLMSGSEWYEMQGYRALNQALGRTIRHRLDYGSILLLDHRYRNPDIVSQLPGWTRDSFDRNSRGSHEEAVASLRRFFDTVQDNVAQVAGLNST